MPFPINHLKLTMGGLAFVTEEWQTGFRIRGSWASLSAAQAAAEAALDDVGAAIEAWVTADSGAAADLWSNRHRLQWVKLVPQDVNGHQGTAPTPMLTTFDVPGSNNPWAAQNCMVASLLTIAQRGLAHRGRMYWPSRQNNVDANGDISGTVTSFVATQTAALISAVNEAMDDHGGTVAVMSNVRTGALNDVLSVTCGNVPDTQRRRRNALAETYATPVTV